jgi:hypothetical protein
MESSVPFTPINFFHLNMDCLSLPSSNKGPFALSSKNYQKYLLPNTSGLTSEDAFAEVALGWNPEGLELYAVVHEPYLRSIYPQIDKGDSLELCIDTRDVKTSGYNTPYCHHFFFLPEPVEGRQAGELTKFRTEDAHELCNSEELIVKSSIKSKEYQMQCFIPASCLHGYDPEQFDRLGMTYRINRANGHSQHFSVVAEDFKFQEQPSLWASLRLVK